jgi:hypothetical protein
MKVGDVYGKKPAAKLQSLPTIPNTDGNVCKSGVSVWNSHKWGQGWQCKRCGFQLDVKKVFGWK